MVNAELHEYMYMNSERSSLERPRKLIRSSFDCVFLHILPEHLKDGCLLWKDPWPLWFAQRYGLMALPMRSIQRASHFPIILSYAHSEGFGSDLFVAVGSRRGFPASRLFLTGTTDIGVTTRRLKRSSSYFDFSELR